MARAADEKVLGREIGGKYQIESFVGGGAMGGVYRARQKEIDKVVAVKVLHRELLVEPLFAARFKREAKAASRLDHPNSMRVLDFGEEPDGLCYIVMELIDGKNLFQIIKEEAPLSRERIVDLLRQALAALAVAHDMGVVHRDLKPENILVVRSHDDEGDVTETVKVCDFGMAKISTSRDDQDEKNSEKLTSHGVVVGTPEYMSPEQGKGEALDGRSDLYSIGVILYQLLTGRLPFTAESAVAVLLKHLIDEPIPPREVVPTADPMLEAVCLRAMKKRPEERFANAREMRAALGGAPSEKRVPAPASSGSLPRMGDRASSRLSLSREHALGEAPTVEVQLQPPPSPTMTELSSVQAAAPRSLRLARDILSDPPPPPKNRSALPFLFGAIVLGGVAYAAMAGYLPGVSALLSGSASPPGTEQAPAVSAAAPSATAHETPAASAPPEVAVPSALPAVTSSAPPASSLLLRPGVVGVPSGPAASPISPLVTPTIAPSAPAPHSGTAGPEAGATPPSPQGGTAAVVAPAPSVASEAGAASASSARVVVTGVTATKAAEGDIRAVLPVDRFQACYRDRLPQMPHPWQGSATVHLDLDPDGLIGSADFTGVASMRDVGDCIVHAAIGKQVAGVHTAGADATVSLAFKLE